MELWMELLLLFMPGLILVSILYILNRVFKYKDKLFSILGTIKYKVAIVVLLGISYYILAYIYGLNLRSPILMAVFYLTFISWQCIKNRRGCS